jgi:uncharacterized repeat protein (TIGR01451 family)
MHDSRPWPAIHSRARFLGALQCACLVLLIASSADAVGTPAGTDIENTATASFVVSGTPVSVDSNVETVTVAEIIDVDVTLQSATPVTVGSGDTNRVLTYLVTNTGNGTDDVALVAVSALGGDDFDPALVGIFLDTDGDAVYTAGVDDPYTLGVNDPTLDANDPANDSITLFVLNDIPAAADGETGDSNLTATSTTGTGAPGTVFAGAGDGGVDAVVGAGGATDIDLGTYLVADVSVSLVKSHAIVDDPFGGTDPVPGATIRWTITVTVTGSGTASGLVVHDPIPANTTYVVASITLDGAGQTDALDSPADEADFDITFPGEISVDLGDVAGGAPVSTITFDVTID